MLYTKNIKKAIKFMYKKHQNQIDKGNIPYIFHPWHIAEQLEEEKRIVVALLHDILEDTNTSVKELEKENFDNEIIEALILLKHDKNIDYFQYIKNLSKNEIAKDVKIVDLKHNLDLSRLDKVSEKDLKRVEKYKKCLEFLEKN